MPKHYDRKFNMEKLRGITDRADKSTVMGKYDTKIKNLAKSSKGTVGKKFAEAQVAHSKKVFGESLKRDSARSFKKLSSMAKKKK